MTPQPVDRVTIDTRVAADTTCDQCTDSATRRVLLDNSPLYLVCLPHVPLVLTLIEASTTEGHSAGHSVGQASGVVADGEQ